MSGDWEQGICSCFNDCTTCKSTQNLTHFEDLCFVNQVHLAVKINICMSIIFSLQTGQDKCQFFSAILCSYLASSSSFKLYSLTSLVFLICFYSPCVHSRHHCVLLPMLHCWQECRGCRRQLLPVWICLHAGSHWSVLQDPHQRKDP